MMAFRIAIAGLLLAVVMQGVSWSAEDHVYKWTDGSGSVHVSGSMEAVPKAYRESASEIMLITVDTLSHRGKERAVSAKGSANVAFTSDGGRIIVSAMFSHAVGRKAIIDTGSEWITITTKLAGALGLDVGSAPQVWVSTHGGARLAPVVTLDSVQVGGAVAKKLKAVVLDFSGRGRVSAVLGMNYLSAFVMDVNNSEQRLSLTAP